MNIKGYVPHIFKSVTINSEPQLKDYTPTRMTNNYKTFEQAFIQSGVEKEKFSFFAKLAEKESGFNAAIQNTAGYPAWGYFQFMQGKYGNREWNNIEDIAGVDVNTFLNNPILQIQSADKLANKFLDSFTESDKRKARQLGYTDSALVAGAWLAGTGGVRKFLNGNGNPSDAHGTNVAQRMKEFNGYFKNGGILRFSSGGTGPGLDKALSDQVSFPTGSFGSNITKWSLEKLNRDYSYDIYRPHLEKIVDIYGDSLFVNNNSLSKREKIDFLYSLRGELSSLDIPKEYKRDLSSLTKYFKNYIDSHTIGYKKETKLPDGSISTAYFDKNKKYLRREGARPKDLNEGIITINVDNDASKLNPHALAELYARYHGIPIARNGMKIKKCQSGGLTSETRKWINHLNGASHYDRVTNGRHYVPFYDRLRTGSPVTLDEGTAYDIVLGDYNGKPIIYSNIMLEDSSIKDGKVIGSSLKDYRNDPDAAYQRAIETRNYITAPSVEVAKNFIDNYQTLGHWYPDFNGSVTVESSPSTKKNVVTRPNGGAFSFIKKLMVPSYVYPTTKTFDINQIADDKTKYDVIVSNRVKMAEDALRRAGYTNQSDIDRLAYFLAAQSIRETGWVDVDPKNNYGGYIVNGVKLRYNSPEEFWDTHINNLNDKYFGWDKSKNINEYLNILNDPDWYMLDESAIKAEQNRREKLGETLYLYAPRYANKGKDYTKEVMDIIDRFTYYYNN